MNRKLTRLSQRYQAALRKHLKQGARADLQAALRLGRQAVALGLETLELAQIHERAFATLELSSRKDDLIKRAELFFAEALTPIEKTHRAALKANAQLHQVSRKLSRRTVDLAASHRPLKKGIIQRKTAEEELRKSGKHYAKLLRESHHLERHLRHLTHWILSAQEVERKKISRELQDEVAQTLLGINVRLLTLKKAAKGNTANLKREIANTQQVVEDSVQSINRFARELKIHQPA